MEDIAIDSSNHDYSIIETVAPTCTEKGYTKETCSRCGHSETYGEVEAIGHICTKPNNAFNETYHVYGYCDNCGCEMKSATEAGNTNHTWVGDSDNPEIKKVNGYMTLINKTGSAIHIDNKIYLNGKGEITLQLGSATKNDDVYSTHLINEYNDKDMVCSTWIDGGFDCALESHRVRLAVDNQGFKDACAWICIPHNWHCSGCGATHTGTIRYYVYNYKHTIPDRDNPEFNLVKDISNEGKYDTPVYAD